MGELGGDDEVGFLCRAVGEGVAVDEVDAGGRVGGLGGGTDGPGVEVDAGEAGVREAAADFPKGVAVAAGDVEDGKVAGGVAGEPGGHWGGGQGDRGDGGGGAAGGGVMNGIPATRGPWLGLG